MYILFDFEALKISGSAPNGDPFVASDRLRQANVISAWPSEKLRSQNEEDENEEEEA